MKKILITVDVEQDCPPFLTTTHGIQYGMSHLFNLFCDEKISATFFTTGKIAEQFPDLIDKLVRDGHEIGCHGYTHQRFDQMNFQEAEHEIETATTVLRKYANVVSFRAPNLSFPDEYLFILIKNGYQIDSSLARYKRSHRNKTRMSPHIQRMAVSLPGYCFRLPFILSKPWIQHLDSIVLLMHPWEFIDMSNTNIPLDCRFNTGDYAYHHLKKWIHYFKKKNYAFLTMRDKLKSLR